MKLIYAMLCVACFSCNWAKQKTKETVNKAGEVAAKTGSEFVNGVSKDIQKTIANEVVIDETLKKQGLQTGKIIILGTDSTTNNILSAYLIFNENFDRDIPIRVISEEGQEYGRSKQPVKGLHGDARYVDFVFDKRTNIYVKGKLVFE